MANIAYTVNENSPETILGVEQYLSEDTNLITSFQVNSTFIPTKHLSELHILTLSDDLIESDYSYNNYKLLQNAQSAGTEGASVITVDPVQDVKLYGYDTGGVKLLYHFLNNPYGEGRTPIEFYIDSISPDRTEVRLNTLNLTSEAVLAITTNIVKNSQNRSYQDEFRLNFKNNDLLIVVNINSVQVGSDTMVAIKLYEPLPLQYGVKSVLSIVEIISDSIAYQVSTRITEAVSTAPLLSTPNFDIEVEEESVVPTGYFNYDELFSYPINNSNSQIFSTVNEKGIDISIDYSDFNNFIQFSSAQERLFNFKYKADLLNSYTVSKATLSNSKKGSSGVSGSRTYYEGLIEGIVNNFDHYERHLYYESGSTSWPKSNNTKPYTINLTSTGWYKDKLKEAAAFDDTNNTSLISTIPTYLREDVNNQNYLTFIYMIGQHFDNLWVYSQAVTDKYDADNRLHSGISKDLVAEALKNFGVKLYTSNKSIEDLFTTFIGQAYQPGKEQIKNYVVGTVGGQRIQPTSLDDYQKDVYKRIYHNLPLLLKSKGTERGLRALINCFGISSDILDIKLYGGRNRETTPFFGDYTYSTSSLDKIRIDHTGSLLDGDTLSLYTSNYKREDKYTDDLHTIEVGFSPADTINTYILQSGSLLISTGDLIANFRNRVRIDGGTVENVQSLIDTLGNIQLLGTTEDSFTHSIDQFLGDPRNLQLDSYAGLDLWNNYIGQTLSRYDVKDYVRLIKFFDNTVFKMVKDFIPARSTAVTGIIIKPHILNRNKAKSVKASVSTISTASMNNAFNHTSSIDTAFSSGSDGGVFGSRNQFITSPGFVKYSTPLGKTIKQTLVEDTKYTGELPNSRIVVSTGELNSKNLFKNAAPTALTFNINFYKATPTTTICTLVTNTTPVVVQPDVEYNLPEYFTLPGRLLPDTVTYKIGTVVIPALDIGKYMFADLAQYGIRTITANAGNINNTACVASRTFKTVSCDLRTNQTVVVDYLNKGQTYNLTTFFNSELNTEVEYTVLLNDRLATKVNSTEAKAYIFPEYAEDGDDITVEVRDTHDSDCTTSISFTNKECPLGPEPEFNIFRTTVIVAALTSATAIIPNDYLIDNLVEDEYYYREATTVTAPTGPWPWIRKTTPPSVAFTFTESGRVLQLKCTKLKTPGCDKIIEITKEVGVKGNKILADLYWSDNIKQACNLGNVQGTGQLPAISDFYYVDNTKTPTKTLPKVLSEYKPLYRISGTTSTLFTGAIVYNSSIYVVIDGILSRTAGNCATYNNPV